MSYLLAVDAGTSSTRTALRDAQGRLLSETSSAYQIAHPYPVWAEMDVSRVTRSAASELVLVEWIPVTAVGLDAAVSVLGAGVVRLEHTVDRGGGQVLVGVEVK